MSERHPIIAITGSSGAGTTSVTQTFQNIFRREGVRAAVIEGDSFHRYDRAEMRRRSAEAESAGNRNFSHFGPENNLFQELEQLFRSYGECGSGSSRKYLHDHDEAAPRPGARHLHALGGPARRYRPAVLRGPARRRRDAAAWTSPAIPTC
jgi:phosphoribulokinase